MDDFMEARVSRPYQQAKIQGLGRLYSSASPRLEAEDKAL